MRDSLVAAVGHRPRWSGASLGCIQSLPVEFAVKSIFLRCAKLAAEVKLTLSPELRTPAGVAVAEEHRFKPAELPVACGVDCVVYRP